MTTFAEWREYGENLGRFASIREKAESPMDRIIIQNKGGVQKLIAGDHGKTLIVTVGPTASADGRAVVPARLLLGMVKTLKAKGDAELTVTPKGATMTTSFDSKIELDNVVGNFKMLTPLPYVEGQGRVIRFPEGWLTDASKYLTYTGDYQPFNQVLAESYGRKMTFRSYDNYIGSDVGPLDVDEDFVLHFPDHLFPALKGLESAGGFYIPTHVPPQVHQAQIGAGKYRVVSVIYPAYGRFPRVAGQDYTVTVQGDKKVLIDTFKALAGRHQFSRVVMEADGGSLTIRSGDNGAAKVNVTCEGTGTLPVNATFMAKVLSTVDGKTATVQFSDSPSLVRVIGDKNGWPIQVSPMK